MHDEAHRDFVRWAAWVNAPDCGPGGPPMGFGKSIIAKIIEGRGMIQPGGKGMVRVYSDPVAVQVDSYLKKIGRDDQRTLKVFYLSSYWTVEKKAHALRVSRRQLYLDIDRIHQHYLIQRCSVKL